MNSCLDLLTGRRCSPCPKYSNECCRVTLESSGGIRYSWTSITALQWTRLGRVDRPTPLHTRSWSNYSTFRSPTVFGCPCAGYRRQKIKRPTLLHDGDLTKSFDSGQRRSKRCRSFSGDLPLRSHGVVRKRSTNIFANDRRDEETAVLFKASIWECSNGVDVFRQDVAVTPDLGTKAFGYCFPPPIMVGHIAQGMAEREAHAVLVMPDVQEHWSPRVEQATTRELALPTVGTLGCPHHQDGVRDNLHTRHTTACALWN